MTKEQIKALVAAKIAGQGSAIDAASVLPTILDAIVDAIPDLEPISPAEAAAATTLEITVPDASASDKTAEEMAGLLGITVDQLKDLIAGNYLRFKYDNSGDIKLKIPSIYYAGAEVGVSEEFDITYDEDSDLYSLTIG